MRKLILASNSPRRKELLTNGGYEFEVLPSDCDETVEETLTVQQIVMELAERKALSVAVNKRDCVVLGCDTVVAIDGKILGKPSSREAAGEMLRLLSGRRHIVSTGVCITDGEKKMTFENTTYVEFYPLSDSAIESYLDTMEFADKAGAYGIQGFGSMLVRKIDGDYFSVMGLPVSECGRALARFGIFGRVRGLE